MTKVEIGGHRWTNKWGQVKPQSQYRQPQQTKWQSTICDGTWKKFNFFPKAGIFEKYLISVLQYKIGLWAFVPQIFEAKRRVPVFFSSYFPLILTLDSRNIANSRFRIIWNNTQCFNIGSKLIQTESRFSKYYISFCTFCSQLVAWSS